MLSLRIIRERLGLKQTDVASKIGVSRQTYNNWELGKREADYESLLKLAELYDTTVENLLTGCLETPVPPEHQPYKMPPEPKTDPNAAYKMPDSSTEHGGGDNEKKPAPVKMTMSELFNRIDTLEESDLDKLIDFIKIMQSDGESKDDLSLFMDFILWKDKKDRP